jgi:hypothetical protein
LIAEILKTSDIVFYVFPCVLGFHKASGLSADQEWTDRHTDTYTFVFYSSKNVFSKVVGLYLAALLDVVKKV